MQSVKANVCGNNNSSWMLPHHTAQFSTLWFYCTVKKEMLRPDALDLLIVVCKICFLYPNSSTIM